jgi:hypothetical protein
MRGLHQLLFLLAISVGLAGVIFLELDSGDAPSEAILARRPTTDQGQPAVQRNQRHSDPQQTAKDVATIVARPLFSPTRRPRETAKSAGATDPELSDVRLTGIVIEPDRRLAIFAVAGAKPRTLSLGEALNGWKLDSISPEEVSLSGPSGTRTLQPKIDTKLVRQARLPAAPAQPPPAAAPGQAPGQPQADTAPGGRPACSSARLGTGAASHGQTPAAVEAIRSEHPAAPLIGGHPIKFLALLLQADRILTTITARQSAGTEDRAQFRRRIAVEFERDALPSPILDDAARDPDIVPLDVLNGLVMVAHVTHS